MSIQTLNFSCSALLYTWTWISAQSHEQAICPIQMESNKKCLTHMVQQAICPIQIESNKKCLTHMVQQAICLTNEIHQTILVNIVVLTIWPHLISNLLPEMNHSSMVICLSSDCWSLFIAWIVLEKKIINPILPHLVWPNYEWCSKQQQYLLELEKGRMGWHHQEFWIFSLVPQMHALLWHEERNV